MSYLPPPSTLPPGSIVDSYVRDSGGPRQDASTDQQITEIESYCQQYGLILRHKFADVAKSGGSTTLRDEFNRLIDTTRRVEDRPRGILLWNYARFARDLDDAIYYKALLRNRNIIVHSLTDPIPEGQYGRIIEFFIDISNEEKRRQTSTDASRGLRDLVQRYGCVPGTPPRGFKKEPVEIGTRRDGTAHIANRWVPDPDYRERVRKAFEMRAALATHMEIHKATQLFSSRNSYTTFFDNKLYVGILEFGGMTIENYCEPMVDKETWDAVQQIVAANKGRQHVSRSADHPRRKSDVATYLLSGIAVCGRCKSPLYGMTSKQRNAGYYYRYGCTRHHNRHDCDFTSIPAKALEKAVLSKLTAFFDDPSNLQALLEADQERYADLEAKSQENTKSLEKQIRSLRRSITNITKAIREHGHSKALLAELADLEGKETSLQSQLQTVKTTLPKARKPLTAREITILSRRISARLQSQDSIAQRSMLYGTVNTVIVDRTTENAFGVINIHSPREPETPDEPDPGKPEYNYCVYNSSPLGGTVSIRENKSIMVEWSK